MNWCALLLFVVMATPVWAGGLMENCEPGSKRHGMQCINRNGLCVEVSVDGHQSQPITKADRKRIMELPDMDDVCWQIKSPVSKQFRIEAKSGGLSSDFIGDLNSLSVIVVPIEDYDPEFDSNRIDPIRGYELQADGYRNGTWQLKQRPLIQNGVGDLTAGEYVIILRIHGEDNWDKQEILLTINPDLSPIEAKQGTQLTPPHH